MGKSSPLEELNCETAAEVFYSTLFNDIPELEGYFRSRLHARTMFINALQCIGDLESGDTLLSDYLKTLADKHREVGISVEHMDAGRHAFEKAINEAGAHLDRRKREFYLLAFSALQAEMGY